MSSVINTLQSSLKSTAMKKVMILKNLPHKISECKILSTTKFIHGFFPELHWQFGIKYWSIFYARIIMFEA